MADNDREFFFDVSEIGSDSDHLAAYLSERKLQQATGPPGL